MVLFAAVATQLQSTTQQHKNASDAIFSWTTAVNVQAAQPARYASILTKSDRLKYATNVKQVSPTVAVTAASKSAARFILQTNLAA